MLRVGRKLKRFALRGALVVAMLFGFATGGSLNFNFPSVPKIPTFSSAVTDYVSRFSVLNAFIAKADGIAPVYYQASYDIELNFFNEPQMNFAFNGFEAKVNEISAQPDELLAQNPSAAPENAENVGGDDHADHEEAAETSPLGELLEKPVNLPSTNPGSGSKAQEVGFTGGASNTGRYLNWPVAGYNYVSRCGLRGHASIDIAGSNNNILAAAAGTVTYAGCTPFGRCRAQGFVSGGTDLGWVIKIDHGNGYETIYAHLRNIYVTPGQVVQQGDWIGQMGSTGNSTGPHLHFSLVRYGQWVPQLNPGPYISSTRICG